MGCLVGFPCTSMMGFKSQVQIPALSLTSHMNLGPFLSSRVPQISQSKKG